MATIDASKLAIPWDHSTVVRGVEIPLLSPLEAEADEAGWRPRGLLPLLALAWERAVEIVTGRKAMRHAQQMIAALWPPEFRDVARSLTGGELLQQKAIYEAAQREWVRAHEDAMLAALRAAQNARAAREIKRTPPAGPGIPARAAAARPLVDVAPGGRIPAALGGQWTGRHAHRNNGDAGEGA